MGLIGNEYKTGNIRESPVFFKNLDALRFFSFLGVFITHAVVISDTGNGLLDLLFNIISFNYLGVPFFFSLSSFLITYHLLKRKEDYGRISLLKFYKNRILRIWPAYYIIIVICFILLPFVAQVLHVKGPTLPSIVPFVFFYVNFYIIEAGSFFTFALVILWSISIEEQFYFVWGIVMRFISVHFLGIFIFILFLASITFGFLYHHVNPESNHLLAVHSLFVVQYFCTGAFAAWIYLQRKRNNPLKSFNRIAFGLVYVVLALSHLLNQNFLILSIVKSVCYGLILYDQSFNKSPVFNAGKFKFINYLGKISYGLYLYHALVMVVLQSQFHFFEPDSGVSQNLLESVIALSVTFLIAHISYRYIESKFLTLKSY